MAITGLTPSPSSVSQVRSLDTQSCLYCRKDTFYIEGCYCGSGTCVSEPRSARPHPVSLICTAQCSCRQMHGNLHASAAPWYSGCTHHRINFWWVNSDNETTEFGSSALDSPTKDPSPTKELHHERRSMDQSPPPGVPSLSLGALVPTR